MNACLLLFAASIALAILKLCCAAALSWWAVMAPVLFLPALAGAAMAALLSAGLAVYLVSALVAVVVATLGSLAVIIDSAFKALWR